MKIQCGPDHDIRTLDLVLPPVRKIGVLVSGGADSVLLYYLLLHCKYRDNSSHIIHPLIIQRPNDRRVTKLRVNKVNALFEHDLPPMRLGDISLPAHQQVESAVRQAFTILGFNYIYLGVIEAQPQHTVGITVITVPEISGLGYPFKNLTKSHIIDLYFKMGIQELLQYTNSCSQQDIELQPCGTCNGCREREWGLAECGITQ
jgi:hypothetical protein